ncbi:hypothetical protein O181_097456 [Austropuccinia psidii MF-1]|uniref:Uncharacterized protein n=1 Tax=Austropuccinia psidii MF-1 TaxID=1389203 RepID=A0A9Q3J908_9BASI|nr:hypothetical protein [Austropuccinia psidii MF-1]
MLADKHTRNVCLLSSPSNHVARGVLAQDALARTPLWSTVMKPYPSANGHRDLKQANRKDSAQLALSPQALICPPPLLGHHPMVTSLLDLSENKTPQNPPDKTLPFLVCLASKPCGNPLQAQVAPDGQRNYSALSDSYSFLEPSRTKEPPIPGPSPSSQPPEVAPTHSTEEPFARPATPLSIIIIDDTPVGSPPPPSHPVPLVPFQCPQEPQCLLPPGAKPLSFP